MEPNSGQRSKILSARLNLANSGLAMSPDKPGNLHAPSFVEKPFNKQKLKFGMFFPFFIDKSSSSLLII